MLSSFPISDTCLVDQCFQCTANCWLNFSFDFAILFSLLNSSKRSVIIQFDTVRHFWIISMEVIIVRYKRKTAKDVNGAETFVSFSKKNIAANFTIWDFFSITSSPSSLSRPFSCWRASWSCLASILMFQQCIYFQSSQTVLYVLTLFNTQYVLSYKTDNEISNAVLAEFSLVAHLLVTLPVPYLEAYLTCNI